MNIKRCDCTFPDFKKKRFIKKSRQEIEDKQRMIIKVENKQAWEQTEWPTFRSL